MKQEEYEQFRNSTIEFIERLNEDPDLVEALKNCPNSVTIPILVGLLEKQENATSVAAASAKLAAIAAMVAVTSMFISVMSLAIVSEDIFVKIGVIVLAGITCIAIIRAAKMPILVFKEPDLDNKSL